LNTEKEKRREEGVGMKEGGMNERRGRRKGGKRND
jgi:hypothetical protein